MQLVDEDPRCSTENPMFERGRAARDRQLPDARLAAALLRARARCRRRRAPLLGEHTDEILAEVLSLSEAEIGRLHDDGVVAGPTAVAA